VIEPLSLQGRGRGPRGAAAWEGEGTSVPDTAVRRALTRALRAVPLPWREREDSSPRAGGESRAWLPSARRLAGKGEAATTRADPHTRAPLEAPAPFPAFSLLPLLLLAGCAATQNAAAVSPQAPGFLHGLWHGFIFPIAWIVSLFMPEVSVYAVPNNGGWYDFGYFIGVVFLGVGARQARRH
jgi:hypothetical protein